MVREASVPIGDTAADYVSFGRGTKPLVLIPGLNLRNVKGSGYALAWMYRVFARDFKVYCIDRKRQILKDYTVEAIAEDYAAAMQALGIHDSYVVGVSQGGMIAQYLAINHPELVRKLVLAVTSARSNENHNLLHQHLGFPGGAGRLPGARKRYFGENVFGQVCPEIRLAIPFACRHAEA